MPVFALMAVGVDRPGNVAAIAGVLVEQGCNLEDTEIAVLRGYSAMMLVVACPEPMCAEALAEAVEEGTRELGLGVTVCAIDAATVVPATEPGTAWSVSVYGSDRPGIVFEVTRLLARAGVNITGMKTRTRGPAELPQYSMALEVAVPAGVDGAEVAASLDSLAGRLDAACSMRPNRRSEQ
jgi:glycine cleavage system transcriptional repressor